MQRRTDHLVTLQSLVDRLRAGGDTPALMNIGGDTVETRSFSTVAEDVERLACGLLAAGVERGEPVGIYGRSGPDWITAFLATAACGALAVPFDSGLTGSALGGPVRDSGCRRLFVTRQHGEALQEAGLAEGTRLYLLENGTDEAAAGMTHWGKLAIAGGQRLPALSPGDQAAMFYTSGTTGMPKGVPLSHANLVANINALISEDIITAHDRVLLPLPLHHVYPLVVGALASLACGAGIVFPAGISGPQIVDALHRGNASVLIGVPRLYSAMLNAINARIQHQGRSVRAATRALFKFLDVLPDGARRAVGTLAFGSVREAIGPRLRLLASGGARLDPDIRGALERFGWTVLTGYGLTETAPMLTFNPMGQARVGSAGRALPGVALRIAVAGADGVGEIEAKGPNVFSGYRNRPDETAAAFTADGWFRTGDLGCLDDDGYLYVVGRAKELIVLPDGKNIFPETVEAVYAESPLIREIAVLEHEGALVGLIVPDLDGLRERGAESAVQLIRDEVRNLSPSLASYERLTGHVLTRMPLPRTAIGKLRRHELAELYRKACDGTTPVRGEVTQEDRVLLSMSRAGDVWHWLAQRFPARSLSLDDSPQLDLGVDSLGWAGLSLEIQDRFGVTLSEENIAGIITLRDLIRAVNEASEIPTSTAASTRPQAEYVASPGLAQRLCALLLYGLFRLAMRFFFRLRVAGVENLPQGVPFIIAPNHASWLDPIAVAASLNRAQIRRTRFAGWTGLLFDSYAARAFSWAAGVFPVDPDRAAASSLALARSVLDQDDILVWFPEGRRTTTGHLLPFQPGIGVLLYDTTLPVVPAFITGTFEAAPTGRRMPRLGPITVRFGAPRTGADLLKNGAGDNPPQQIADALREAVGQLEDRSVS